MNTKVTMQTRMYYPVLVNHQINKLRTNVASRPYKQVIDNLGRENFKLLLRHGVINHGKVNLPRMNVLLNSEFVIAELHKNGFKLRNGEGDFTDYFEALAGRCMEKNNKNFKLLHEFRQIRPKEVDDEVNKIIEEFFTNTKGKLTSRDLDIVLEIGADLFNNKFFNKPIIKIDALKIQNAILEKIFKYIDDGVKMHPSLYGEILTMYKNLFLLFPRYEFIRSIPESVVDIMLARIANFIKGL